MAPTACSSPEVERPISITYEVPSEDAPITETFDYLVVACDPRELNIRGRTPLEREVNRKLSSYTFLTSLYSAVRPERPQYDPNEFNPKREDNPRRNVPNYAVRFNPHVLEDMDGRPYGFRDEVYAHDIEQKPDPSGKTWTTVYQLENKGLLPRDRAAVKSYLDGLREEALEDDDEENIWWDWKPDVSDGAAQQPEKQVLVDYFPHFRQDVIRDGLPWEIKKAQGEKNTIYVASFASFESVLHCYLYENLIMGDDGPVMTKGNFPKDKDAKFAVIGAGPSGLLFASQHLKKKGFNRFTLFEKESRFGGKTHTVWREAPTSKEPIPCELGTCYLSPAYQPLLHLFEEYDAGQIVALDKTTDNRFRSIIDPTLPRRITNEMEREDGMEYARWTVVQNMLGPNALTDQDVVRKLMVKQTVMYCYVHAVVMRMSINDPIPKNPPPKDDDDDCDSLFGTILKELQRLFDIAKGKESDDGPPGKARRPGGVIGVETLCETLAEENLDMEDVKELIETYVPNNKSLSNFKVETTYTVEELQRAVKDVYYTTFGEFLDKYGLGMLKGIFVYGYQVQGYGTIKTIPAYYGMVWITPTTMVKKVMSVLNPAAASAAPKSGATTGTVNISTKGWGTLWKNMVKQDGLQEKIIFNANITGITRSCK